MDIGIRGIERDPALRARVVKRVGAAVKPLQVKPVVARVTFFDDDGPKDGPAVRCALTVRVPYRPSIRVEDMAQTPRLAFDGALVALERRLERYRERDRESRRRPKKYFAAKRLSEGEEPRPQKAG